MPTHLPGEHIPLIGHQIARIGRVIDITAQPCDPDPVIAVLAFFYAAPIAFGTLFKPAYLNDQEEHFAERPGLRTGRHGRRRFDVEEEFPGIGATGKKVGWVLFKVQALLQRLGWYFMIADVATQLAVNWTSLAYVWGGCGDPTAGRAKAICNFNDFLPGGWPAYVALWDTAYARQPAFSNGTYVGTTGGAPGTFIGDVTITKGAHSTTPAPAVSCRFVNVLTGQKSDDFDLKFGDPQSKSAAFVHRDLMLFGAQNTWALEILHATDGFGLNATMRIDCQKLDGIGFDP